MKKLTLEVKAQRERAKRIGYLVREAAKAEEQLRGVNKAIYEMVKEPGALDLDEADLLTLHHTIKLERVMSKEQLFTFIAGWDLQPRAKKVEVLYLVFGGLNSYADITWGRLPAWITTRLLVKAEQK